MGLLDIGHFIDVKVFECTYVSHQKSACSYNRFTNTHNFVFEKSFYLILVSPSTNETHYLKKISHSIYIFNYCYYFFYFFWSRVKQVFCCCCCWCNWWLFDREMNVSNLLFILYTYCVLCLLCCLFFVVKMDANRYIYIIFKFTIYILFFR